MRKITTMDAQRYRRLIYLFSSNENSPLSLNFCLKWSGEIHIQPVQIARMLIMTITFEKVRDSKSLSEDSLIGI